MIVTLMNRKFRVNWKHEPITNRVDEWLRQHGNGLAGLNDGVRDSLLNLLRMAAPLTRDCRKRNGFTTCFIEEVDGDLRVEGRVECSLRDTYSKENGRRESLHVAAYGLSKALGNDPEDVEAFEKSYRQLERELNKQYWARMSPLKLAA